MGTNMKTHLFSAVGLCLLLIGSSSASAEPQRGSHSGGSAPSHGSSASPRPSSGGGGYSRPSAMPSPSRGSSAGVRPSTIPSARPATTPGTTSPSVPSSSPGATRPRTLLAPGLHDRAQPRSTSFWPAHRVGAWAETSTRVERCRPRPPGPTASSSPDSAPTVRARADSRGGDGRDRRGLSIPPARTTLPALPAPLLPPEPRTEPGVDSTGHGSSPYRGTRILPRLHRRPPQSVHPRSAV
jgi:hypothetical protein